jgi:small subunit ribosomal protein S2
MKNITLEELLEAGCHFGHQVTRQNPKARDYIFEARDNINIIDLEKTKEGLDEAQAFVLKLAQTPGSVLIVLGTKRQAASVVKSEIERAEKEGAPGLYSVTNRWIGGILTNFSEISRNFKRMNELNTILSSSTERTKYTKKELLLFEREKNKLESFYGGISRLEKLPDALYVIDTHLEDLAVREAIVTHVPVVGITDTNADPTIIKHAIPANDDAVGSIQLITSAIVDAWIEGKKKGAKAQEAEAKKAEKEAKKAEGEAQRAESKKETKGTPLRPSDSKGQAEEPEEAPNSKSQAPKKDESEKIEADKSVKEEKKAEGEGQRAESKEEKPKKTRQKKEEHVVLSEEKKKETEKTPEEISVE